MNEQETETWIDGYQKSVEAAGMKWYPPHVTTGQLKNEYITCEWSKGKHSLTAFLSEEEGPELIKCWGHRIHEDMESVSIEDQNALVAAWKWMQEG